ncbi:hypothetical protein ACFOSV_16340 [Algoriphagus namhaensis]|uniref:Aerotolerance regulator N-terminal domain-containing protein n=1 Tax=Algoriphagus namhaensis TaxID=915353 RepID=A0ABV8AXS9_9BACT
MALQPIVSPIFAWVFGIVIVIGFGILIALIQKSDLYSKRKAIKHMLHALLTMALLAFILNPVWLSQPSQKPLLVFSEDLGKSEVDFWKDSLSIEKAVRAENFESNENSLVLLGREFSKEFLYSLRANSLDWVIPEGKEPNYLNWKGVLTQGEVQKIQLGIDLKSGSGMKLFQAGNEIGEYTVDADQTNFQIEKSANILGRNEWKIVVDEDSIGVLRFFVLPNPPIRVQLQTGFPGPEIRTLGRYLSGKGEKVQEDIQLSKNTGLRTENLPADSVDVFVIDPSQIQNREIQKQLDRGASVLLLNLSEPVKQVEALNKAFGTGFQISSMGPTENRLLENKMEALPFEMVSRNTQRTLFEKSFAVQKLGNSKVGVSLLAETFSLAQAGDSLAYSAVWDSILGELRPDSDENWKLEAPLFQNEFYTLAYNGTDSTSISELKSSGLRRSQSLINPNSTSWEGFKSESGWQKVNETIEAYFYSPSEFPSIYANQQRAEFMRSKAWESTNPENITTEKTIPFWVWGLIFGLILTAIWLEPKFEF